MVRTVCELVREADPIQEQRLTGSRPQLGTTSKGVAQNLTRTIFGRREFGAMRRGELGTRNGQARDY